MVTLEKSVDAVRLKNKLYIVGAYSSDDLRDIYFSNIEYFLNAEIKEAGPVTLYTIKDTHLYSVYDKSNPGWSWKYMDYTTGELMDQGRVASEKSLMERLGYPTYVMIYEVKKEICLKGFIAE